MERAASPEPPPAPPVTPSTSVHPDDCGAEVTGSQSLPMLVVQGCYEDFEAAAPSSSPPLSSPSPPSATETLSQARSKLAIVERRTENPLFHFSQRTRPASSASEPNLDPLKNEPLASPLSRSLSRPDTCAAVSAAAAAASSSCDLATQNPLYGHRKLHSQFLRGRSAVELAKPEPPPSTSGVEQAPAAATLRANPLFGDSKASKYLERQRTAKLPRAQELQHSFRRTRRDSLSAFQTERLPSVAAAAADDAVHKTTNPLFGKTHPAVLRGLGASSLDAMALSLPTGSDYSESDDSELAYSLASSETSSSSSYISIAQPSSSSLSSSSTSLAASSASLASSTSSLASSAASLSSSLSSSSSSAAAVASLSSPSSASSSSSSSASSASSSLLQAFSSRTRLKSAADAAAAVLHLQQQLQADVAAGEGIAAGVADVCQRLVGMLYALLPSDARSQQVLDDVLQVLDGYQAANAPLFAQRWGQRGMHCLLSLALSSSTPDELFSRTVQLICTLCASAPAALEQLAENGGEYALFQAAASDLPCHDAALGVLSAALLQPALRPVFTSAQYQETLVDFIVFEELRGVCPQVGVGDVTMPRAALRRSAASPAMYGHCPVSVHELKASTPALCRMSADLMSVVDHPNVLPAIAACIDPPGAEQPPFIVAPYHRFGALTSLIFGSGGSGISGGGGGGGEHETSTTVTAGQDFAGVQMRAAVLDWRTVAIIAEGLANGFMWLHSRAVHSPLNPDRIVVADDYTPKILLAFEVAEMSPRYLAPELIRAEIEQQDIEITEKSNVYSYAILVWELLTAAKAYRGCTPANIASDPSLRPFVPPNLPQSIVHILTACWQAAPDERPKFAQIAAQWQRFTTWLQRSGQSLPPLPLPIRSMKRSVSAGRTKAAAVDKSAAASHRAKEV